MNPLSYVDTDYDVDLPGADNPLALSLNESPFVPLPEVRDAMVRAVGAANRYPEFLPEQLRRLIAGHLGVSTEQVVPGAGATGVVMQILRAVTRPGERMVMAYPTFDGYPIFAKIARLTSVTVPLDGRGHNDLEAIGDAACDARVVVLCRPHNPTGTVEPEDSIRGLLTRISRETIVVLDEAYVEFVSPTQRIDIVRLVDDFPNVVVVRTFSKAYGLAGIRTGYAYCSPVIARMLWPMQLPFGSTDLSLAAVDASFRAGHQLIQRVAAITDERTHLRTHLHGMGVWTTESHANFLYLPAGGPQCREHFDGSGPQLRFYGDGGVRITVGTRESSHAVLAALSNRAVP